MIVHPRYILDIWEPTQSLQSFNQNPFYVLHKNKKFNYLGNFRLYTKVFIIISMLIKSCGALHKRSISVDMILEGQYKTLSILL